MRIIHLLLIGSAYCFGQMSFSYITPSGQSGNLTGNLNAATSNWTNSSTVTAPFILGLDDTTPFAAQGSSSGGAYVVAQ